MFNNKIFFSLLIVGVLSLLFLVACAPKTNNSVGNEELPAKNGEVLVWLKENALPKTLEKQFSMYELKSKGQASRSEYVFNYVFNASKVNTNQLINELEKVDFVVKASAKKQGQQGVRSSKSSKGQKVRIK